MTTTTKTIMRDMVIDGLLSAKPRTVGIEIECLVPQYRTQTTLELIERGVSCFNPDHDHCFDQGRQWYVAGDGSVYPEGEPVPAKTAHTYFDNHEVQTPILRYSLRHENHYVDLDKVLRYLAEVGSYTNWTCGLHVHVGVPDYTTFPLRQQRLLDLYMDLEKEIEATIMPYRIGRHDHYYPLDKAEIESAKSRYFRERALPRRERNHRSLADVLPESLDRNIVNLGNIGNGKNTVEFRQHEGTLDQERILSWVDVCVALTNAAAGEATEERKSALKNLLAHVPEPPEAHIDPDKNWYYHLPPTHFRTQGETC